MAEQILAVQKKQEYVLPQSDRFALLSRTAFGRRALLIERQRNAFIKRYGDPFGDIEQDVKNH